MQSLHPAFTSPRYREAILATKPSRYFRCNEGSGVIIDQAGGANATIIGTPTKRAAVGPVGIADAGGLQTVNNGGAYASAGNASWAVGANGYTLMCWFYMTATTNDRGLFGRWRFPNGAQIYSAGGGSTVSALHQGVVTVTSGTLALNRWHHVAQTWDKSTVRLYVNGSQIGTGAASATAPVNDTANWNISTLNNNVLTNAMSGIISEAVLWPRALLAGEIAHFATLGFGR